MAGHEKHNPKINPVEGCPQCDAIIDRPLLRGFGQGKSTQVLPGRKAYNLSRLKDKDVSAIKAEMLLDATLTVEEAVSKVEAVKVEVAVVEDTKIG